VPASSSDSVLLSYSLHQLICAAVAVVVVQLVALAVAAVEDSAASDLVLVA